MKMQMPNPGLKWHKAQRKRYSKLLGADLKAGHGGAAEYWQGAMSAEGAAVAKEKYGHNGTIFRLLQQISETCEAKRYDDKIISVPMARALLKSYAGMDDADQKRFRSSSLDKMAEMAYQQAFFGKEGIGSWMQG
jgi:hypothetical protein